MSRKSAQKLLTAVVVPAGLGAYVLLVLLGGGLSPMRLAGAFVFTLLYLVLGSIDLVTVEDVSMSPEMLVVALGFLAFGPAVPVAELAVGSTLIVAWRRRPALRVLYTCAQFGLALAAFTAVWLLLVGRRFGMEVIYQILDGDVALGLRYTLAVVVGATVYVAVNVFLLSGWISLGKDEGGGNFLQSFRSDASVSVLFAFLAVPGALLAGSLGWAMNLVLVVPALAALWGVFQFVGARLGSELTVARRLTAFFTACMGSFFLGVTLLALLLFSRNYSDALVAREVAVASARLEAVAGADAATVDSAIAQLLAREPTLAYVQVRGADGGTRLQVAERWRRLQSTIAGDLQRDPVQGSRILHGGAMNVLRTREALLSLGGLELRLGADLAESAAVRQRLGMSLALAALTLFLLSLLVLSYYLRTQLRSPLARLGAVLRSISEGDADLSQRLPVHGDHEISELGEHFNRFADNLAGLVGATGATAQKVAGGAGDLAASIEQLAASASEVSTLIESSTTRIEQEQRQAEALHELTSVLARLNGEVAERTLEARREAGGVVAEVERSREGIARAGEALLAVREVVREAGSAGGELIRVSAKIGDLVQVIRDMAARTNLLALNAAIEAARAGEHGRGFAVVADEVRKLADGSARAANEAGELIVQVSARADELGDTMRRGGERVDGVEGTAAESAEALRVLVDAIHRIDAAIGNIAERMVKEREAVEQVDAQVRGIEGLVRENAEMAVQVAAAAQEQNSSTEDMTRLSVLLAEEASGLRELVGRFRVEERPDRGIAG